MIKYLYKWGVSIDKIKGEMIFFTIIFLVVKVLYRCKNGELKLGNICLFEVVYFILKHEKYFYLQAEVLFSNSFKWVFISYFRGHGKW